MLFLSLMACGSDNIDMGKLYVHVRVHSPLPAIVSLDCGCH